jgi:hypothetical protein
LLSSALDWTAICCGACFFLQKSSSFLAFQIHHRNVARLLVRALTSRLVRPMHWTPDRGRSDTRPPTPDPHRPPRCRPTPPANLHHPAAQPTRFLPRRAPPLAHPRCSPSGSAPRTEERLAGRCTSRHASLAVPGHLQGPRHGGQRFERAKGRGRGCVVLPAGATAAQRSRQTPEAHRPSPEAPSGLKVCAPKSRSKI